MECPKCKNQVSDDDLICSHCKKVLKLKCPKCDTINKGSVCSKCGFVIISKCHNCGKINPTINGKCSKCGFNTYTSVAIKSSNIDEFACLSIEFPNIIDIHTKIGAEKLIKILNDLILTYCGSIGTAREILEETYIIRFNKENSFKESCMHAMKAALEILQQIGDLNFELEKQKHVLLECKIAILKRDIYAQPEDYKSGLNIRMIQGSTKHKYLSRMQLITDQWVYQQITDSYDFDTLTSIVIKNTMVMLFEAKLKKYLKLIPPKEEEPQEDEQILQVQDELPPDLPEGHQLSSDLCPDDIQEFVQDESYEREQMLYNKDDSIYFSDLKCVFDTSTARDLPKKLINLLSSGNKIISIRGKKSYRLCSNDIVQILEGQNMYQSIYRVTCNDDMKYKPYGFFYELLVCIHNFAVTSKLFGTNNFDTYSSIDEQGLIKSLMNMETREYPHPEDVRFSLFDIFATVFESMQKTLIYIENIEKIDDTSLEILQTILQHFKQLDITIIATADKEFLLHKKMHYLLSASHYAELKLMPLSLKTLVAESAQRYKELAESHYFVPILQGAKGSYIFFKNAIDYLMEMGQVEIQQGNIVILENNQKLLIPPKLTDLMVKRLLHMQNNPPAFNLFSRLLLFGPMFDLNLIKILAVENGPAGLKDLYAQEFLFNVNGIIYITEYDLMKAAFDKLVKPERQQEMAIDILTKLFIQEVSHPAEVRILSLLDSEKTGINVRKEEFRIWDRLLKMNASMGDFSAYLSCSTKLLKLLDEDVIDENSERTVEDYKLEIYENISNLIYKYAPNDVYNMSKMILQNLGDIVNVKKVTNLCNKMLQGCLISGNYAYAPELLQKIMTKFSNVSLNPDDENFSVSYFLLSLIKIEILFNIGNLSDCMEAGEAILSVVKQDKIEILKPAHLTAKQFEETILDSMFFAGVSKVILLQSEEQITKFIENLKTNVGNISECFNYLIPLSKILKGHKNIAVAEPTTDNKFSVILYNLIMAFSYFDGNYEKFANVIYQAKLAAKDNCLTPFEYICDLLIGYSYYNMKRVEKASSIFYNVLETSQNNGLKLPVYASMYLTAELKFLQGESDIALGLSHNASTQIERDDNLGAFLFFLFRILMTKVYASVMELSSADACLKSALYIANKNGIEYNSENLEKYIEHLSSLVQNENIQNEQSSVEN